MSTDVEVRLNGAPNAMGLSNVAELGAILSAAGLDAVQVKALTNKLQEDSLHLALSSTPEIISKIQDIQNAKVAIVMDRVTALQGLMGYVHKDTVLALMRTLISPGINR